MDNIISAIAQLPGWLPAPEVFPGAVILLSLKVSLSATFAAALIGAPLGAALAIWRFPLSGMLITLSTALMALPPVVVGLFVYVMLSRAGPLGSLGLLFTPGAMIIAQSLLVLPIIVALTREVVAPLHREYHTLFLSNEASRGLQLRVLLWDARFGISTAFLAGFGRAIAEVGAVLIVGGNIEGVTRVMTTSIALETSRGHLSQALALGFVLILIVLAITSLTHRLTRIGRKYDAGEHG